MGREKGEGKEGSLETLSERDRRRLPSSPSEGGDVGLGLIELPPPMQCPSSVAFRGSGRAAGHSLRVVEAEARPQSELEWMIEGAQESTHPSTKPASLYPPPPSLHIMRTVPRPVHLHSSISAYSRCHNQETTNRHTPRSSIPPRNPCWLKVSGAERHRRGDCICSDA
ncbi:hypothetical protein B0H34DRAFT_133217 [Crassisporium funariophilum]|nr:hypothetical protein B0H34DRAFT_133217 [Crassisporium funariophilum]